MKIHHHANRFPVWHLWLSLLLFSFVPMAYGQTAATQTTSRSESACRIDEEKLFAGTPFMRTELYFGRNIPGGGKVSKKDWESFLNETVTPRFPEGLTVLAGAGQFLDSRNEIEEERSAVLILLYPLDKRKEKSTKIEEIRERYKQRFQQESVMRLDAVQPVWVSF